MSGPLPGLADLMARDRPRGPGARVLRIGRSRLRLDGVDPSLATALDTRWGQFVSAQSDGAIALSVSLHEGGPAVWLDGSPDNVYRLEASRAEGVLLVRSHHFGLCEIEPGKWRMAITSDPGERIDRLVENAVRYLVARTAAVAGGMAFHGAAVVRDGRAHLFLGASGAGKTTAVGLLSPAASLGDDYALAIPEATGWSVPSVPFDNRETAPADRPVVAFPLAGIWRLFQSPADRVETLPPAVAAASLMSCAALPWAMPDLTERLIDNAKRLVEEAPYAHLHFRKTTDLWRVLGSAEP